MSNSTEAHYNNREECSHVVATSFTVVLSTISLLAGTGNLLVIITFIKTANLRTSPNYYIVNMAVSDLIAVILNWPLYATEGMLKPGGNIIVDPNLAAFACKLGIYSRAVSYVVSVVSLVLIAVDRFIATAFPLKALKTTGRIRKILLLLSWILPALCLIPYLVYSKIVDFENCSFCKTMISSVAHNAYNIVSFVLFYLVPMIVIFLLYPLIIKRSRRIRPQLDNEVRSCRINTKRDKQNQNIMKIFGSIILVFFTCWTPLYVYFFLNSRYPSIFIKDKCLILVGLFYYALPLLSTAVNPFMLIAFSSNYRAAIKSVCRTSLPKCNFGYTVSGVSPQGQNVELQELK